MFDQLYKAQRARERHLNAPLVDERIRYLSHWAAQGSVRSSLRVRAQDLLTIIEYLDVEAAGQISEKQIINAADRWAKRQPQPPNVIDFHYGKLRFIYHARQWIAFLRRLRLPKVPRPPYAQPARPVQQLHARGKRLVSGDHPQASAARDAVPQSF